MRISDWSSDVCSSDLVGRNDLLRGPPDRRRPVASAAGGAHGVERVNVVSLQGTLLATGDRLDLPLLPGMSARGLPHPSASDALDPPLCLAWRRTTGRLPALWPAGCGKGGLAGRCEPGMRLQPEPAGHRPDHARGRA